MVVNFIMLLAMYPMMMAVGFVMYNSTKPKGTMIFGSRVPAEYAQDEIVKQITAEWKAEMKRNMIINAILPFSAFLVPYVSIQMTIWTMWVFVMIGILELPFIRANAKVKEAKRTMGWDKNVSPEAYVELEAAGEIRRVKVKNFLPPIITSMLAVVAVYGAATLHLVKDLNYVRGFGIIIITFALLNFLLLAAALWMDKQRVDVISTKNDVNLNYARAKKNIWKDFWLQSSWVTTIFVWVCAISLILQEKFGMVLLAGSVVYSFVVVLLIFPLARKLREVENAYEGERDITLDSDDDKYWIAGLLYNNPRDKHTSVPMRNGLGTTVNMGTTLGKALAVFSAAAILSCPILCGWVILEEFTPISLSIEDDKLVANHLKVEYELELEDIEAVEVVSELPRMTKSVGSGMDKLRKGIFIVPNDGRYEVFLNPQNGVFLKFKAGEKQYYMSGKNDAETMLIYEVLQ